jgi:hypothetical protein
MFETYLAMFQVPVYPLPDFLVDSIIFLPFSMINCKDIRTFIAILLFFATNSNCFGRIDLRGQFHSLSKLNFFIKFMTFLC